MQIPQFTINPEDKDFINNIKSMGKRLEGLERAVQPYIGDWYFFNVSDFSWNANNIVNVNADMPVETFFQVGDKIWVTQTTEKYFYVIGVDSTNNRITLNAGDDYTFTNGAFTLFASSRVANPIGHPQVFDFSTSMTIYTYDGTWDDSTSVFGGGSGIREGSYSMNGSIATVSYLIGTNAFPANVFTIVLYSPFLYRSGISQDNIGLSTIMTDGAIGGVATDIFIDEVWGPISPVGAPAGAGELGAVIAPARSIGAQFNSGSLAIRGTFSPAV